MMLVPAAFMNQNPVEIVVDAADFDGSSDYMTRGADFTSNADSKKGIFSGWFRIDGGDGTLRRILTSQNFRFVVVMQTSNPFVIAFSNSSGTTLLNMTSSAFTAGASWRHLLASWDMGAGATHLYVDGVSDKAIVTGPTDDTIDYTDSDWRVGASPSATQLWNGAMAEVYFAPGQYLDFSKTKNVRKFRSADGKPVFLGSDGRKPTGAAPIMYLHLADAETVSNFATNRGTGGNFSITGTLDTASSSPSG